ncbi:MAG TPA: hypothetical protein VFR63_12945 [Gaiellaceae bacterium]|nr:hypothetical protein [Gaiellaceae bacterium]
MRSIMATLVPMRRASSKVETPAASASVAKVWRSRSGGGPLEGPGVQEG